MSLIKSIESKIKVSLIISGMALLSSVVIVVVGLFLSYNQIREERKKIYVLDNGHPVLIKQIGIAENRQIEYQSHINMFHLLFWTIPPDDKFIQQNLEKAMYLVDESGLEEFNNLKERGYYNAIMSSSTSISIQTDSIKLDMDAKTFAYYGRQRIERESKIVVRSLVTTGHIRDLPERSENNPHACMIYGWKTVKNEDLSVNPKYNY